MAKGAYAGGKTRKRMSKQPSCQAFQGVQYISEEGTRTHPVRVRCQASLDGNERVKHHDTGVGMGSRQSDLDDCGDGAWIAEPGSETGWKVNRAMNRHAVPVVTGDRGAPTKRHGSLTNRKFSGAERAGIDSAKLGMVGSPEALARLDATSCAEGRAAGVKFSGTTRKLPKTGKGRNNLSDSHGADHQVGVPGQLQLCGQVVPGTVALMDMKRTVKFPSQETLP